MRTRLPVAYAPKDWSSFQVYAANVARHYKQGKDGAVNTYQILNEPVYTDYALPRKFGYTVKDYIRSLEAGYEGIKRVDANCQVVGGISANIDSGYTREFVEQGGLRFLDAVDLHIYDAPKPADNYATSFMRLNENMDAHGGRKPIWITEWGCYADDDPPCIPQTVGDATMNRCRWRNERAATEHIVKFVTVGYAYGLRKLFFHAGTCGTINGPDAGGVLFEYGGTPRKMLAGVAVLTEIFGAPEQFVEKIERDNLVSYVFRATGEAVAVAWCKSGQTQTMTRPRQVEAFDVMGNRLTEERLTVGTSPVYFRAKEPGLLRGLR